MTSKQSLEFKDGPMAGFYCDKHPVIIEDGGNDEKHMGILSSTTALQITKKLQPSCYQPQYLEE